MRLHKLSSMILAAAFAASLALKASTIFAASVDWVGANNGYWDVAANWNPASPGPTDEVLLGGFDTELRTGSFNILSLAGTGQLTLSGGSLSFASASSVGSLAMSGGAIDGVGTLSVGGASVWTGGNMTGSGSTSFNGDLAISGNVHNISERAVNFAATTTWTGGDIAIAYAATLTNSGAFLDQNAGNVSNYQWFGSGASFNNAGTYTKTGAGVTDISIGFNNTGIVNVNAGTLALGGSVNSSGSFNVASGATLQFSGSTHTLATVDGTGLMLVSGGTVNTSIASTFVASSFAMTGGTIDGVGALTISGASTWTGGAMNGAGSTTFNGDLAISGNVHNITSRAVNFAATTTWTGGDIAIAYAATLTNSGAFLDQNAGNVSNYQWFGSGASFNNAGTYTKTGAGVTDISIGFNNTGIVNVNAGTLALHGSFGNSGTVHLQGGAINIAYASEYLTGEWLLEAGTTITSSTIRYVMMGAHVRLPATASFLGLEGPPSSGEGYLYENHGFLELGKAIHVSGTTVPGYGSQLCFVNSGEIATSNGLYAQSSGGPSFLRLLNSGYLHGSGLISFPAGVEINGGTLRGEPTLNMQDDITTKGNCLIEGEVHAPSLTVESGTLTIASGASLAGVSYPLLVENNGGHMVVSGTVTGGIKLNTAGSQLSGTGTVSGNVNGIGEISSTGTLALQSGLLTQGILKITSGTLSVAGTTTVSGGELIVDAGATLTGPGLLELNGGTLGGSGLVQKNVKVNQGPSTLFGLVGGGIVLGGDADVDAEQGFSCMGNLLNYGTNAIKGTVTVEGEVDVQPVQAGALVLKPDTTINTKKVKIGIFGTISIPDVTSRIVIPPVPGALILNDGLFESTAPVQNTATFAGSGTFNAPIYPQVGALNIGLASIEGGHSPGTVHFSWAGADALTLDGRAANAQPHIGMEISDAAGTAGNPQGWDMVDVPNGGVILNVASGDKIIIDLRSLLPDNATIGPLSHFDPAANYLWPFMIAKLGFTGTPVTSDMFHVADGSFAAANGIAPGLFQVVRPTPNSLAVQYGVLPSFWFVDAGGDWSQAGNWNSPVPNGVGTRAFFGNVNTAPRTVDLGLPVTVGEILFDSSQSFTLAGTPVLTLDASQGDALLTVTAGHHAITVPLVLNDDLSISTMAGTSLTISGDLSGVGKSLTKNGEGELLVSGLMTYDGDTTVNAGTITVGSLIHSPNVTVHGTLNATSLVCDTLTIGEPLANLLAVPVPEPSVFAMLGILGVCLGGYGWQKRRRVS